MRDWLEAVRINGKPWDKTPPAPRLPDDSNHPLTQSIRAKTAIKSGVMFKFRLRALRDSYRVRRQLISQ